MTNPRLISAFLCKRRRTIEFSDTRIKPVKLAAMYFDFYGFNAPPFSITPDPRFVFLTERHRDALAHLLYGIGQGGGSGFVLLSGDIGTGKTTLCRLLLEQLPANTRVALVLNPKLTPLELLINIAEELHIEIKGASVSAKKLIDRLNQYLLDQYAAGQRIVLIIDEAQNLSVAALEQIRLLTNLETATQKLLQIILLGQPELRDLIAKPELQQLAQRITARYHLSPLDQNETEAYLRHRIAVAGAPRFPFAPSAIKAIYARANGVPRLINVIADRALLGGFVTEALPIHADIVQRAADEVLGNRRRFNPRFKLVLVGLVTASLIALGYLLTRPNQTEPIKTVTKKIDISASSAINLAQTLLTTTTEQDAKVFAALLQANNIRQSSTTLSKLLRCPFEFDSEQRCLRDAGSLSKLKALNTPVILLLRDRQFIRPALLLSFNNNQVEVKLGEQTLSVSEQDLQANWFGNYLALFKVPENFPTRLAPGEQNPNLTWVRAQVQGTSTSITPLPTKNAEQKFDLELAEQIRQLQLQYGVIPDAIIGPETQFLLSTLVDNAPRLGAVEQHDLPSSPELRNVPNR